MQTNNTFSSKPSSGAVKLRRQQLTGILALLNHPTTRQAADAAGVSEVTLWRWLQSEVFQRAYLGARREVVKQAMAQIQRRASEAVQWQACWVGYREVVMKTSCCFLVAA